MVTKLYNLKGSLNYLNRQIEDIENKLKSDKIFSDEEMAELVNNEIYFKTERTKIEEELKEFLGDKSYRDLCLKELFTKINNLVTDFCKEECLDIELLRYHIEDVPSPNSDCSLCVKFEDGMEIENY